MGISKYLRHSTLASRFGVVGVVALCAACDFNPCVNGGDIQVDSDGDKIPDCVETDGADIDNDGTVDVVTHTNPQRKDIFVKIDWMGCGSDRTGSCADGHDHRPNQDAINDVAQALAAGPIGNPDGSTGIDLQVELGEELPHQEICDCACLANLVDNNRQILSVDQRNSSNATNLLEGKRKVVHYFLWGHKQDATSSSGIACTNAYTEISLGDWAAYGTRTDQSGTFLHELGHQLGLGHGGGDGINNKPNYLSVMNYSFQTSFTRYLGGLNYSTSSLPALNEDSLDETLGIGSNSALQTSFFARGVGSLDVSSQGPIDWNRDGDKLDTAVTGLDINNDGVCITSGSDNNLDSRASGDDQYFAKNRAGWLVLSDTTRTASGDDAKYIDPTTHETRISTGLNSTLDTPVQPGDTLVSLSILNGADHTCDSATAGDDSAVAASGATETRVLNGFDDWGNLQLDLLFQRKGALGATPPSPLQNPSEPELTFEQTVQQRLSDVTVDVHPTFSPRRNTLEYEVRVGNLGPDGTTGPAHVDLRLPTTAANVTCQPRQDGTCVLTATGDKVLIDTVSLAPGETRSFVVDLKVDASACATPASYVARVDTSISNIEFDPSNDSYTVAFPDADSDGTIDICGWPITDLSVYGTAAVRLGARAQVLESAGPFAYGLVASRGNDVFGLPAFQIGASAKMGDALGNGSLFIDAFATVNGDAVAKGSIFLSWGAQVLGAVRPHQVPSPALPALLLVAPVTAPSNQDVTAFIGQSLALPPGHYRRLTAFLRSQLTLTSGDYSLDQVSLLPGSKIVLDTSAGPIRLFVRSALSVQGSWVASDPGLVLLAYAGSTDLVIGSSMAASVLAPAAEVVIGSGFGSELSGAVLAKEVQLSSGATVRHFPFRGTWPWRL